MVADDKPTSSTILDFAKRHGVCVAFVYKMAQRQREYDAAVARGEVPKGPRPIAPRIVKMGRVSRITSQAEQVYLDELQQMPSGLRAGRRLAEEAAEADGAGK
jgi:hypothetical protein